MTLRALKRAIFGVAITASAMAYTPAIAQVKLDLSNEYSATSIVGLADKFFIEAVKKKTNGEVIITAQFGGALGFKSKDHFDAVGDGAVPLAGTYTGVFTGIDPVFALSAMPFLTPTVKDASAMFEAARPFYDKVFAKYNQKLLYASPYPPTGIWARKAVKTKADLKGLKIRTYDAAGVTTLKQVGAAPIQLSWGDVVPQLSTGGIDAVLTSGDSGISGKFWEHLKYFNAVPYSIAINMTHMNLDAFNKLSPSQQKALEEAAKETQAENWARIEVRMKRNVEILKKNKVTVVSAPAPLVAELQRAGNVVLKKWLEDMGQDGKTILDRYKKSVAN